MATLTVQPRPTPEKRAEAPVQIEVDDAVTVWLATIEEWVTPRPGWEYELREGHDLGRANNIELRLRFVGGDQASSVSFRVDQLELAEDTGQELFLGFEERDGIARSVTCTANGLDVDLFHVLTFM